MSREIKFRMVYKTTGEIIGYTDAYRLLRYGDDVLPDYEKAILQGVSFEQYTGIKDKSGKEIYEGDIIKARDWDGDWGKYRIKWKQSHCAFEAFEYRKSGAWNWTLKGFVDIEVIGNIHENLELVGGEE